MPHLRSSAGRRDLILLAGFVALWLFCWGFSAASIVGGSRYPALSTGLLEHPEGYPVVTGFLPWLPGERSGIRVGDRLIRIGGTDMRGVGPIDLVTVIVEEARGADSVPVVFEQDGTRRETTVVVGSMMDLWPSLPTSVVFMLTGVLLFLRARPDTPGVRATAAALLVIGLYLGTNFIEPRRALLANLVIRTAAATCLGPLAMRAMFASVGSAVGRGPLVRYAPWLLGVLGPLEVIGRLAAWPQLETALLVTGAIVVGTVLVTATYLYRRADAVVQRQGRWVFYGLYCSIAPALVLIVAATIDPTLMPLVFVARLASAILPVCIVIAIVRYDLFDVDRLISATVSYNVVLIVLVAGGFALVPRVAAAAASTLGVDPSLGQIAIAVALAGVIVPAHRRLRPQLERVFFPERYAIDRGIERLLCDLSQAAGVERLLEGLGEGLHRLVNPESCVVFAAAGATYGPVFARARTIPPALPAEGPLLAVLRQERGILALGSSVERRLEPFARAALETLDGSVIVPLRRTVVATTLESSQSASISAARPALAATSPARAAHGLVSFTPPATTCLAIGDAVPQVYRWLAKQPGGAVLDLRGDYPRRLGPLVDAASAMLGSLVHGHPLLGVHSHYIPPASVLVMHVMQRPPSPQVLQALVDMTHVRWIVLPPSAPGKIDSGWPRVPGVVPAAGFADGRVFEVRREPRFAWLSALSASPRDDRTLLGTSLAPVTDPRGEVAVTSPVRSSAPASHVVVSVHVVNRGATAWPVAAVAEAPAVHVEARWRDSSDAAQSIALPWDLEPGEAVDVIAYLASPAAPSRYTLDVVVEQGDAVFPVQSHGPEIEVR